MKRRYRWEVGTQLENVIQSGNAEAAEKIAVEHLQMVRDEIGDEALDEIRVRTILSVNIAGRAAYNAGANPDLLFRTVMTAIRRIIRIRTLRGLEPVLRAGVRDIARLVADRNYVDDCKVRAALDYINRHIGESLTRTAVAEVVGCSPEHLSRIFSRSTGRTFKDHLLHMRIERAKELLKTRSRVIDVALDLGFQDPNYFSYVFKTIAGVTPTQYRRKIALKPV